VGLVIAGILLILLPLGPPLSNPEVIPKSDPHAGLAMAQSASWGFGRLAGLVFALLGAALLAVAYILRIRRSPNKSLERTRDR
jgi:hypothetical protein